MTQPQSEPNAPVQQSLHGALERSENSVSRWRVGTIWYVECCETVPPYLIDAFLKSENDPLLSYSLSRLASSAFESRPAAPLGLMR